ncbi:attachment protein [Nariva virus]|uniref:Attachment protein n=1 Tax=Nariva virus TaxID=590647 RepID=B8XH64_9MONO|nr:attachment protein [Nariva virus]ACL97359.1 attachment protein [Nariva virus]7ZM6_A Chain A, Attachment protein [Narmovirus narivaense]7ZM6_B Chain B, Attachment protein [Narmovirus narivaense]
MAPINYPASYYTNNAERPVVITTKSTESKGQRPLPLGNARFWEYFGHVCGTLTFCMSLIGIIVGIIALANYSSDKDWKGRIGGDIQVTRMATEKTVKLILEDTTPKLRNILDSVLFQLPKMLASIASKINTQTPPPPTTSGHSTALATQCSSNCENRPEIGYDYLRQVEQSLQRITNISIQLLEASEIHSMAGAYPNALYKIRTQDSWSVTAKECPLQAFQPNLNLIPAMIGTATGALIRNCVRQPVIVVDDGVYMLTYLAMRGSCQDHQKSVRHFEMGVITSDPFGDPVPTPLRHWTKRALPAYDGCALAVKGHAGFALCTETSVGPLRDRTAKRKPNIVLFKASLVGELSERVIPPQSWLSGFSFFSVYTVAGKGYAYHSKFHAFGNVVRVGQSEYQAKCRGTGCPTANQDDCNTAQRVSQEDNTYLHQAILSVDIDSVIDPEDVVYVIERDQYYQASAGDLYRVPETGEILYNLHNGGWSNEVQVGRIQPSDRFYMREIQLTSTRVPAPNGCNRVKGCPGGCVAVISPAFTPMHPEFNVGVGIFPMNQPHNPSIMHVQQQTELFWKPIVGGNITLHESSIACYSTVPPNPSYDLCIGVMTLLLHQGQLPQFQALSWYQPTMCNGNAPQNRRALIPVIVEDSKAMSVSSDAPRTP